jgi:hypothetical protein
VGGQDELHSRKPIAEQRDNLLLPKGMQVCVNLVDKDDAATLSHVGYIVAQRLQVAVDQAEHRDHRGRALRAFLDRQRVVLVAFTPDIEREAVAPFTRDALEVEGLIGQLAHHVPNEPELLTSKAQAFLEVIQAKAVEEALDHPVVRSLC